MHLMGQQSESINVTFNETLTILGDFYKAPTLITILTQARYSSAYETKQRLQEQFREYPVIFNILGYFSFLPLFFYSIWDIY